MGGIAGRSEGDILGCVSQVEITGDNYVGGIVGYVDGSSEIFIVNCYKENKVLGSSDIGGICGYMKNTVIVNCYTGGAAYGDLYT